MLSNIMLSNMLSNIMLSNNLHLSLLRLFAVIEGSVVLPAVALSWLLGSTRFNSVYCS
jgi:hypothetical protein